MSRAFTEQVLRLGTVFHIQIAEQLIVKAVRIEWNKTLHLGEIIIYTEPFVRNSRLTEKRIVDIEWPTTSKATQDCPSRMA